MQIFYYVIKLIVGVYLVKLKHIILRDVLPASLYI